MQVIKNEFLNYGLCNDRGMVMRSPKSSCAYKISWQSAKLDQIKFYILV